MHYFYTEIIKRHYDEKKQKILKVSNK